MLAPRGCLGGWRGGAPGAAGRGGGAHSARSCCLPARTQSARPATVLLVVSMLPGADVSGPGLRHRASGQCRTLPSSRRGGDGLSGTTKARVSVGAGTPGRTTGSRSSGSSVCTGCPSAGAPAAGLAQGRPREGPGAPAAASHPAPLPARPLPAAVAAWCPSWRPAPGWRARPRPLLTPAGAGGLRGPSEVWQDRAQKVAGEVRQGFCGHTQLCFYTHRQRHSQASRSLGLVLLLRGGLRRALGALAQVLLVCALQAQLVVRPEGLRSSKRLVVHGRGRGRRSGGGRACISSVIFTVSSSAAGAACAIGSSAPLACCNAASSSLLESPALGFLARRGKTTRLALYALSLLTFSCARAAAASARAAARRGRGRASRPAAARPEQAAARAGRPLALSALQGAWESQPCSPARQAHAACVAPAGSPGSGCAAGGRQRSRSWAQPSWGCPPPARRPARRRQSLITRLPVRLRDALPQPGRPSQS